ncbi:MAG: hypothetical protein ACO1PI_00970 [Bacteroidota bacterium]
MKKTIVIGLFAVLSACSAKILMLTQADADRGAVKFPGVTVAQLTEGKKLYEDNCGSCHALINPKSESESEWRGMVPVMAAKVNKKAGSEVLDAKEQELILQYVLVMHDAK